MKTVRQKPLKEDKEMNQNEKRVYLIETLLKERRKYTRMEIPANVEEQKRLLRSLMNVRLPKPISEDFLKIQDEYLKERNRERGITDIANLKSVASDSRLFIWQGDITTLKCDAIVNACNSQMLGCFSPMHACIDNFIHTYAGIQLRNYCQKMMDEQGFEEPAGQVKITPAFNLNCDYVIHTVGPIVQGKLTKDHEKLLASCYESCMKVADENNVKSIAFCCISTGVFCFPNDRAAQIAVNTVKKYKEETGSKIKIIFNVFKDLDKEIYEGLLAG